MKKLFNKKGLMGIDYICVAGVVLAITVYVLSSLYPASIAIADDSLATLASVSDIVTTTSGN